MNDMYNESLIKSLKATVINSQNANLTDSEKKVIDALDKLGDFLKSYNDLDMNEKQYLSQIVGKISFDVTAMTIIINAFKK